MKKQYLFIALIISISLMLGSWVDPNTIDVYDAQIYIYDKHNSVTDLSGDIQYFLHDYNGICYSSNGYIYNSLGSAITGRALIRGTEYNIRIDSFGGLSVYQPYYQNNIERWHWQPYNMVDDQIPGSLTETNTILYVIAFLALIISIFIAVKMVIK